MEKKLQTLSKEKLQQDSSAKMSTQELCKKYGIPFQDTTKEHLGESSIIFLKKHKKN